MMRAQVLQLLAACAIALGLTLAPAPLAAEEAPLEQSKAFFKAGASAYELGDYLAAIQALEAAYRLTPLPAIAFSLAQAQRRQYFVSHARPHLERAIVLYQTYLREVVRAGRRADATDALAQLEPLAASLGAADGGGSTTATERTRMLISCPMPAAQISLDGATASSSPLIAQVCPGSHQLLVSAPGYFPHSRSVEAVEGELVPIEVALREQPATMILRSSPKADVHVDGAFAGRIGAAHRYPLASGSHLFSFGQNGHELQLFQAELAPGSTTRLEVELLPTSQRKTAIRLFLASGATLIAGGVLTAFALSREHDASVLERRRQQAGLDDDELFRYRDAARDRDVFRAAAIIGFSASIVSLAVGMFLYMFDQPDLNDRSRPPQRLRLSAAVAHSRWSLALHF
jgi:hypothetical protein